MKNILIIGNGFDLSLGLKSSYDDFFNSSEFSYLTNKKNSLAAHLIKKKTIQGWIDVENEIRNYGNDFYKKIPNTNNNQLIAKSNAFNEEHKLLVSALQKYLKRQLKSHKPSENMQIESLFSGLNLSHTSLYTFNYTDLYLNYIDRDSIYTVEHVHGSLKKSDIVFGTSEDTHNLLPEHRPIQKSFFDSQKYSIIQALEPLGTTQIVNVIIFGHSLGFEDHDYFKTFFSNLTQSRYFNLKIYTKGESSKEAIKSQISEMSGSLFEFKKSIQKFEIIAL